MRTPLPVPPSRPGRPGHAGPRPSRRGLQLLAAAAAAGSLGSCAGDGDATGGDAPVRRVVLISCDTLRADRLGVYGYGRDTSPHADALAREGIVFEEAYACAPHTGPALSSLFASRMPDEIGVAGGNRSLMPTEVVTFPELLRDAGIPTGAVVSNWALRREAEDVGVQQGFAHYDDEMGEEEPNRPGHFERLAPDTTAAALAWVEERLAAGEDRFFLWVHYMDPHGPYTPPEEYARRFDRPPGGTGEWGGEPPLQAGKANKGLGRIPRYQLLGDERRPGVYRDRYDAEIRFFDDQLGALLAGLEERDLLDGSLVILTSDHGESLGEHDYWFCHGENVFRETVRVPLVVRPPRAPGAPPPDGPTRVAEVASHLDLWPTVLEAFGLPAGAHRGTSLLAGPLPAGRIAPQTLGLPDTPRRWLGIGDGHHRLVLHDEHRALFDVRADPAETNDLARSRPEVARDLEERYRTFLDALPAGPALHGAEMTMDEETLRAMEALGYVEVGEGEE